MNCQLEPGSSSVQVFFDKEKMLCHLWSLYESYLILKPGNYFFSSARANPFQEHNKSLAVVAAAAADDDDMSMRWFFSNLEIAKICWGVELIEYSKYHSTTLLVGYLCLTVKSKSVEEKRGEEIVGFVCHGIVIWSGWSAFYSALLLHCDGIGIAIARLSHHIHHHSITASFRDFQGEGGFLNELCLHFALRFLLHFAIRKMGQTKLGNNWSNVSANCSVLL